MEEGDRKEEIGTFRALFESVKSKFDFVSEADNCLDRKAGTLMGIEFAIAVGYLSFVVSNFDKLQSCWGDFGLYFGGMLSLFGLVLLTASVFLLILVIKPKDYATISVNIFEYKEYWRKSEIDLLKQIVVDAQDAFTENNGILKKKTNLFRLATHLLIFSLFSIILSYIPYTPWVGIFCEVV